MILLISYHQSTNYKKNWMLGIYLMLFIFEILNVLNIIIPNFLETPKLMIYIISIGIFMTILYKVLKKSGN
jgi:hypothetical protein